MPALLIECGYMDNPTDLKYLQDDKNQEKIARDILEGIRKYSMETTRYAPPIVISNDSIPTSDTISQGSFKKFDPNKIESMNVDRNTKLITITTKDGRKYYEIITPEMIHSWDSIRIARDNASDVVNANQVVFTKVEVESEYPGGQQGWYDYLIKNLKYPQEAIQKQIHGTVIVKFLVRKDGTLAEFEAISGPDELKAASVQVIANSGKWIPAKNNGVSVDSYKEQPINYALEEKKN